MRLPQHKPSRSSRSMVGVAGLAAALGAGIAGCTSPLDGPEQDLRRSILESTRRELREAQQFPGPQELGRTPRVQELGLAPEIRGELERMSGMGSYAGGPLVLAESALGESQHTVLINLQRAIVSAAENNLSVQFARISPAISEAQLTQAEAVFDWVLFSDVQYTRTNEPLLQTPGTFGLGLSAAQNRREDTTVSAGVRRQLTSGGRLSIQQTLGYGYIFETRGATIPTINPAWTTQLGLGFEQPLLRNFGSGVALAEVRLARNAERDQIQLLKANLLQTLADTEEAYWSLVFAEGNLRISQRLIQRGIDARDTLVRRSETVGDVRPSQLSDATATIESRRADVIRAENTLRAASDRLKVLMNDPDLTIGSEVVVLPVDRPIDQPIRYNLADAMLTAIGNRPEVQRALLVIDDSSIRQGVAENQRLPQLDFRSQLAFTGLDEFADQSFRDQFQADFVNYIVGLAFEQPIGNRGAEAQYRRARLERMQALVTYRDVIQRIVADVKSALRTSVLGYTLIEQTRAARVAAAENLRTLQVEEATTGALTAEFLDLKLRRQAALASAESQELQAVTDYNTSIARLNAATGVGLERNRIKFEVPSGNDLLDAPASLDRQPGWREREARAGRGRGAEAPPLLVPRPGTLMDSAADRPAQR